MAGFGTSFLSSAVKQTKPNQTSFLYDFQRGFVASGVVQLKNFNKMTPPNPTTFISDKCVFHLSGKTFISGGRIVPLALQGVEKSGLSRVKHSKCWVEHGFPPIP